MIKLLRLLLYPVSICYGLILHLRNWCFDKRLLYSFKPKIKTICVGNLSVGGTGKTPHIEYLVRLLQEEFKVATLSRGYKRKSRGFRIATLTDNALTIGDEPAQYYHKFIDIIVAVDSRRIRAIKKLRNQFPNLQVILLDDAYQHRSVTAGLNVMLSDFSAMYYDDQMLPTGNLREFKSGIKRADIIVVSKTPPVFSPIERRHILSRINADPNQLVCFSYIKYSSFTHFINKKEIDKDEWKNIIGKDTEVLLFAGIANPSLLEDFVRSNSKRYELIQFEDHHTFTKKDMERIAQHFADLRCPKKIILTTEKDAMRLYQLNLSGIWNTLPFYYVSIAVQFHQQDEENFNNHIINYVRSN